MKKMMQTVLVVAVAALLLPAATAGATTVGLWLFDENSGTIASDSSGNGNHGLFDDPTGDPAWVSGQFGSAVQSDGDDRIRVPYDPSLNLANAMTLETWINFNGLAFNGGILQKDDSSDVSLREYSLIVWGSGGAGPRLGARLKINGVNKQFWSYNVLPTSGWTHVAFTWDGTTGKGYFYVNGGAQELGGTAAGVNNTGTSSLTFFQSSDGWLPASLDEIRISDVALSANQLGYSGSIPPIPEPGSLLLIGSGLLLLVRKRK